MKLLALDTSSLACAVGVISDGKYVTRYEEQPREHTKLLMPMIRDVLEEAHLAVADLDAIVLGKGPGSFIGVRIAASVAQGLAYGAGIGIVPVSSMAAVAVAAGHSGQVVAVTQDAHMQQVYLGIYRLDRDGQAEVVVPERLQALQTIIELGSHADAIAAGQGWHRYPALLELNSERITAVSDIRYPASESLLKIGEARFRAGAAIPPDRLDPAYLRQKVAEIPRAAKP